MLTGLSHNLQDISDARKTAVINDELYRLNVDIVGLQETRLAESGSIKEKDYTFYWKGESVNERREHGVGFAVRNNLLKMVEVGSHGSERILTLRLSTTDGYVTLISVYAPTQCSTSEAKDAFYECLSAVVNGINSSDQLILLGDFNARVGSDRDSWPSCLGYFGVGKTNDNGQRLLEFCTLHHLCITNTYFNTKPQHRVSWRHPRSKHWHQLDLILVRRPALKSILITRSFHSADCDTDHSLVCCKMRTKPKVYHHSRQNAAPRIDVTKISCSNLQEQFAKTFERDLNATATGDKAAFNWEHLRAVIYR